MSLKQNTVLYNVEDRVATIRMNRPSVKNAINLEMHEELYAAFKMAKSDHDVQVIVLTGAGDAFSSGADIKSIPLDDLEQFDHGSYLEKTYNSLILLIDQIEKPVVAYINGIAVGAGLSLALACDFRIADEQSAFALSFLQIGLIPDAGASYYLPRLVGLGKALELSLGKKISAKEAVEIGLVNKVGDPSTFIQNLKRLPYPAYYYMKRNMKAGFESTLRVTLDMEVEGQRVSGKSAFHKQAVMKFVRGS
ncbi:enoyl-CoA hydratase/isomerase family protein [Evansella sp. AB-rgal1]|uniref:enoyl-CoA hydratase/isomerase family protein n=1 Tax=Evansella sp. AB-rgal1 TaxID=3242696 RepID=UPI00359CDE39